MRPEARPEGAPASPVARLLLVGALLATGGCAEPHRGPVQRPDKAGAPADPAQELAALERRAEGGIDPWPHYELALAHEERGDAERAIREYGKAINLLEPRTYTAPVFRLGVLHDRLGNLEAAARCFQEVVATVAGDSRRYRENPHYRLAAVGLRAVWEDLGQSDRRQDELAALRERFLRDFGGGDEEWAAPPPWRAAPPAADDRAPPDRQ
ncbi:MAG: tetratricopeptide repeat protein [Planctomycetes bacterium]|nr:tetratricopeptide repeat protein [Planctomycetota bacterium]